MNGLLQKTEARAGSILPVINSHLRKEVRKRKSRVYILVNADFFAVSRKVIAHLCVNFRCLEFIVQIGLFGFLKKYADGRRVSKSPDLSVWPVRNVSSLVVVLFWSGCTCMSSGSARMRPIPAISALSWSRTPDTLIQPAERSKARTGGSPRSGKRAIILLSLMKNLQKMVREMVQCR